MPHHGKCLCGSVQFDIQKDVTEAGACHCEMCRQWTGGIFIAVAVPDDAVDIQGAEHLCIYASSEWAERAFCGKCGSSLWYRVTAEGSHQGEYLIGLGTLEAPSGIALTEELFIDRKPDGYSFSEKTHQLTAEEVFAMFAEG